jgi:hypothetical protein
MGITVKKAIYRICFPAFLFFLLSLSLTQAEEPPASEASEQEASPEETQATLASLFGRGAKMPGIPRIEGTVALPSFDNSGMQLDESVLIAAERESASSAKRDKESDIVENTER